MVNLENQGMMTDLSAVHGISTSGQNLFNSLNYQRISLNFNSSKFFKNFSARLPKRMIQTVLVAKGEENRITRLCGREGR